MIGVWKDAAVNVGGAVLSRALLIAALPIITRQFSAEQIGLWPVILSLATMIAPFATLRLEIAVPMANRPAARVLMRFMGQVTLALAFLTAVLLVAFPASLRYLTGADIALGERLMIPVQLMSSAALVIVSAWLIRKRAFAALALSNLGTAVTTVFLLILLPRIFGATTFVLLFSVVSGHLCGTMIATMFARRLRDGTFSLRAHSRRLCAVLRRYAQYPRYALPYSLSAVLVERGLPLVISAFFGLASVGGYFLLRQALFAPVGIVTTAFRQVVFGHAAGHSDAHHIRALFSRVGVPVMVMIPMGTAFVMVFALGPALAVLGADWVKLEAIAPAMLVHACSLMITAWMDRVFDLKGRQRLALAMQVVSDIVVFAAALILAMSGLSFSNFVVSVSLLAAIYNVIWLVVVYRLIGYDPWRAVLAGLLPVAALAVSWACFRGLAGALPPVYDALAGATATILAAFALWHFWMRDAQRAGTRS